MRPGLHLHTTRAHVYPTNAQSQSISKLVSCDLIYSGGVILVVCAYQIADTITEDTDRYKGGLQQATGAQHARRRLNIEYHTSTTTMYMTAHCCPHPQGQKTMLSTNRQQAHLTTMKAHEICLEQRSRCTMSKAGVLAMDMAAYHAQ